MELLLRTLHVRIQPSQQTSELAPSLLSRQDSKLRHKEIEKLPQATGLESFFSWNVNPESLIPEMHP